MPRLKWRRLDFFELRASLTYCVAGHIQVSVTYIAEKLLHKKSNKRLAKPAAFILQKEWRPELIRVDDLVLRDYAVSDVEVIEATNQCVVKTYCCLSCSYFLIQSRDFLSTAKYCPNNPMLVEFVFLGSAYAPALM